MPYEIDFLRAGDSNGDAIIVRWAQTKESDYYINVIDGGFTDTGDEIIDHIRRYYTGSRRNVTPADGEGFEPAWAE
jgi:hypothetical protein